MNDIRDNIKAICKEKGFKQEVLADIFGITQSSFSQRVSGNDDIKYGFLLELADILKVDVIDIIKYPVKYVPEEDVCSSCREKEKTISNLNFLLEQFKENKIKT